MSLDFPAAPAVDTVYNQGTLSWKYDGAKWLANSAGAAAYVAKTGDTMSGALTLPGAPTVALHAATKAYVDAGNPVPLPIASGGTNATTAPAALTSLGAVAKAGDTMSGTLSLASPGTANLTLVKNSVGDNADINSSFGGNTRWSLCLGDAAAEAGSNAGTDFVLHRFADGGGYLAQALNINRATGNATFSGSVGCLNMAVTGAATPTVALYASQFTGFYSPDGFNNNGAITIGSSTNADTNHANTRHLFYNRNVATLFCYFNVTATYNVSGAWATISSAAVKEQIEPYKRGLEAILELNPVQFRYQAGTPFAEADKPSRVLYGLIAEEVAPHVPEIVGRTTAQIKGVDTEIDTLEPGNLVYALINAVKTLAAEVAALKAAR